MESCTTLQEISCGLNIFSKPMFRPVFLYCTLTKTKSTETTVIVIRSPDLLPIHTGILGVIAVSTKSDQFDPKICRTTLVLLSWCDISVILQSYFDHILTDGRKCCLNVIPAGSFSLSFPLPPPSPFFLFSPILAQMSLFTGYIQTDFVTDNAAKKVF